MLNDLSASHIRDLSWQDDALCAEVGTDPFFPEKGDGSLEAKSICGICRVREQCLVFAISTNQQHGIWGGLTPSQRRNAKLSHESAEPQDSQEVTVMRLWNRKNSAEQIADQLGISSRTVHRIVSRSKKAAA